MTAAPSPRPRVRRRLVLLAVPAAIAVLVAGCGSSDKSGSSADATTTTPASASTAAVAATGGKITVDTTEYAFAPKTITAKAGKLKVTLVNKGKIPHELVVLKSAAAADALKVTGGRVSEKTSVGEVSETNAGVAKSAKLDLKPGTYVYVCNIPGHYADGMYGTLTVK